MFNLIIIFCAKYLLFLLAGAVAIYYFNLSKQQNKEFVIFSIISLPAVYLVAQIGSWLYFDPRPFVVGHFVPLIAHNADNGFPSDHALLSSALAMATYFFNKKIGLILLGVSLIIGLARVLAGVHHLVDIIGSILISLIISWLVYILAVKLHYINEKPKNHVIS